MADDLLKPVSEDQIRAALDGKFVAYHFTGRLVPMIVPADFNPFSKEGQAMIRRACEQKVLSK